MAYPVSELFIYRITVAEGSSVSNSNRNLSIARPRGVELVRGCRSKYRAAGNDLLGPDDVLFSRPRSPPVNNRDRRPGAHAEICS